VAALADYLGRILADLPESDTAEVDDPPDLSLREPVVAAWTIGSMGVAYAEETDRLIIIAEELTDPDSGIEPATARFTLRRRQVAALVERAQVVVSAGRPPCQYCGRPLEPVNGDWCPCQN